jgi:hypothetical protein
MHWSKARSSAKAAGLHGAAVIELGLPGKGIQAEREAGQTEA